MTSLLPPAAVQVVDLPAAAWAPPPGDRLELQGAELDRAALAVLDAWLAAPHLSPASRRAYLRDFHAWTGWLAAQGRHPMTATRRDVDGWDQAATRQGLSTSTRARRRSSLAGFYRRAVEDGVREGSPVMGRHPVVQRLQQLGPDRDELGRLLAAAEQLPGWRRTRAVALVRLLTSTGLRVSEALGADVTDLGTERGHHVLDVRRKGDRPARVPLPPATAVALVEVVDGRSCGPLFVTGTGGRFDDRAARRLLAQLGRAAGVPADRAHPHALRHSFVTLALDAGVPLQAVQDAADHADPRTTRGYDRRRAGLDGHPSYALSTFLGW